MWQALVSLIFGGTIAVQSPLPVYPPASIDEILSYECAKAVAEVTKNDTQLGPIFMQEGLVFTSLSNSRGDKLLVVNSGQGIFSLPLTAVGVSRIRFSLPVNGKSQMSEFYITYIHGERHRSRVLEFSVGRAPMGRDELDYQSAPVSRSASLLPHLDYAIFQTTEGTVSAISSRRLLRQDLNIVDTESCDHMSRRSPALARNMRFDFDLITRAILGPKKVAGAGGGRMPASQRP